MSISILKLDFTTKEEYFAWRAEWIKVYNSQSIINRQSKRDIKTLLGVKQSDEQRRLHYSRLNTTYFLEIRKQSKIKAGILRAEALAKA